VVPRPNLAERANRIAFGLLDERLRDLLLAHRRELFRIEGLRVEASADDDWHPRHHRNTSEEADVAAHIRMAAVDDAADAFAFGGRHLLRHELGVGHEKWT